MLNRNLATLTQLSRRLYFTIDDLVNTFRLKPDSAKVLASRYCQKGVFLRLKKGIYTLTQNWEKYSGQDFLKMANLIQVPSYISFTTALGFYEVTTQVQQGFVESAAVKRTRRVEIKNVVLVYYKLKKKFYFNFVNQNGLFIATKEKALIDALYLYSLGKYRLDFNALSLAKLNLKEIRRIGRIYPVKTRNVIKRLCGI